MRDVVAGTLVSVDRNEFRARRTRLRPLLEAFRHGRLEQGGSGGCTGLLFLRLPDGTQFFLGGVNDNVSVEAVVEAVNFALDLCDEQRRES